MLPQEPNKFMGCLVDSEDSTLEWNNFLMSLKKQTNKYKNPEEKNHK